MPSLKAIASDLGVSHALVSRVLNNRMGTTRVSKKTREAILARAKELDYQPNPLAVALKKGRKGVIGVFMHGVGVEGSEMSFDFIRAAGKSLSDLGLNLWLQFFQTDEEFLKACNQNLLRKIDGLVVAGLAHARLQERLKEIESQGLHVVSACHGMIENTTSVDFHVTNFQVDYVSQCLLTTNHLIERGCRKIAHFKCSPERYTGFLNAHRSAGLVANADLIIETKNYTALSGYQCMKKLLEKGVPFDGLVAQSDAQASGAMSCLLDFGRPKDSWPRITGVDDSPIARHYCHIPLTSVTAEMQASAELAVQTIFNKIEGAPVSEQLIRPNLVIRESTMF